MPALLQNIELRPVLISDTQGQEPLRRSIVGAEYHTGSRLMLTGDDVPFVGDIPTSQNQIPVTRWISISC